MKTTIGKLRKMIQEELNRRFTVLENNEIDDAEGKEKELVAITSDEYKEKIDKLDNPEEKEKEEIEKKFQDVFDDIYGDAHIYATGKDPEED